MRNPFDDPQRGDILRLADYGRERHVTSRETSSHDDIVRYKIVTRFKEGETRHCSVKAWQRWCAHHQPVIQDFALEW